MTLITIEEEKINEKFERLMQHLDLLHRERNNLLGGIKRLLATYLEDSSIDGPRVAELSRKESELIDAQTELKTAFVRLQFSWNDILSSQHLIRRRKTHEHS